jgi:hypothetical protein
MQLRVTLNPDPLTRDGFSVDTLLGRVRDRIDTDAQITGGSLVFTLAVPAGRKGRTVTAGLRRKRESAGAESLAELIRVAHRKLSEHDASPLDMASHARMRAPADAWSRQRLGIGLLAPDIQKAVLQGTLPSTLDPGALLAMDLPLDWYEQRRTLGMVG